MPRHRPSPGIWSKIRRKVWLRDGGRCQGPYCQNNSPLSLNNIHIDHIQSGKLATNALGNLRVLCRRCHSLRLDHRHRGMIASALQDGLIPADWRRFAWDDDHWPSAERIAEMERWDASRKSKEAEF